MYLDVNYKTLQTSYVPGLIEFPEKFMSEYFKPGKRAAGFVKIKHDGEKVTSCVWDDEAYQKWDKENPDIPQESKPTEVEQLRADIDYLAMMQGVAL